MRTRFLLGFVAGATTAWLARRNGYPGTGPSRARSRRLVRIIAHELRTPTSIILGYQELLSEGLLGPLDPRALDALDRIHHAAGQLRDLTDGLQILTGDTPDSHDPGADRADTAAAAAHAVRAAAADAEARGVALRLETDGPAIARASDDTVHRLLDLIVSTATRTTPGRTITLAVSADGNTVTAEARGALLPEDPRDSRPDAAAIDSATGLRIAIARRIALGVGGTLDCTGSAIRLRLPAAPAIDASGGQP